MMVSMYAFLEPADKASVAMQVTGVPPVLQVRYEGKTMTCFCIMSIILAC